MKWQPIETYDKMKKKPPYAVFWFEASSGGHSSNVLSACPDLTRTKGYRVCTHWMPFEPPKETPQSG